MEKEILNAYAARVSQANKSELVVIILEALSESISEGKECLKKDKIAEARREIERARGFLTELMGSLDLSYEISHYLRRLYVYAYEQLCQGMAQRDVVCLDHASNVIEGLLPAFRKVAEQDTSGSVMQNTESIYAGLTYGRNHELNESVYLGSSESRGFQA